MGKDCPFALSVPGCLPLSAFPKPPSTPSPNPTPPQAPTRLSLSHTRSLCGIHANRTNTRTCAQPPKETNSPDTASNAAPRPVGVVLCLCVLCARCLSARLIPAHMHLSIKLTLSPSLRSPPSCCCPHIPPFSPQPQHPKKSKRQFRPSHVQSIRRRAFKG